MKLAIISSALMMLSLSSCKKDFLDLPSETNLSTPVFFKTQEDFEKAVNGEYEPLRTSYARAWVMGEMRSDNTHYFYSIANRGTLPEAEPISDFIEVAANRYTTEKYVMDYLIIARVNQVLDLIDAVEFDESVKNNLNFKSGFFPWLTYELRRLSKLRYKSGTGTVEVDGATPQRNGLNYRA